MLNIRALGTLILWFYLILLYDKKSSLIEQGQMKINSLLMNSSPFFWHLITIHILSLVCFPKKRGYVKDHLYFHNKLIHV